MKYRKLRIAWSVGWGLAAVLLIVLWVRSYWWKDWVTAPISRTQAVSLNSSQGRLRVRLGPMPSQSIPLFSHYSLAKFEKDADESLGEMGPGVTTFKAPLSPVFGRSIDGKFSVAHGLVVLFFAALGVVAAPCIKWRFTLRTLLIATTLVAVVLGLVVWAAR
jgi:hypothetical protein